MEYKPYFVMALEKQVKNKDEEEKLPKVVLEPKLIVARDEKSAATKMLLNTPELASCDPDRLEIFVRPF